MARKTYEDYAGKYFSNGNEKKVVGVTFNVKKGIHGKIYNYYTDRTGLRAHDDVIVPAENHHTGKIYLTKAKVAMTSNATTNKSLNTVEYLNDKGIQLKVIR